MPNMRELVTLFESNGYGVSEPTIGEHHLFGWVTGGKLDPIRAIARATDDLCNVGSIVGVFDGVPERNRYSLLTTLLELNFDHPLACISMVRAPADDKDVTSPSEKSEIGILVAETSFFWTGSTAKRLEDRMEAIRAIMFAASQQMASRGALSNTNPFYDRLRGATSPVGREGFPK
jgi:hypothetical protein